MDRSILNWYYVQVIQSSKYKQFLGNHYRHLEKLFYVQSVKWKVLRDSHSWLNPVVSYQLEQSKPNRNQHIPWLLLNSYVLNTDTTASVSQIPVLNRHTKNSRSMLSLATAWHLLARFDDERLDVYSPL